MIDTLQEIIATLRRAKLRTALTGISVSTGIFLFILLLGAGNGIINAFSGAANSMMLDVMSMYGGFTSKPYNGLSEGRSVKLDSRDMGIVGHNFSQNVVKSTGKITQGGVNIYFGKQYLQRDLTGVGAVYRDMDSEVASMRAGRFINETDERERRKVVVISEKDATELFGHWSRAVGNYVDAGSAAFRVVGVYPTKAMRDNRDVYVPLTTLRAIYGTDEKYDEITLKTRGITTDADVEAFAKRFRRFAGPLHQYSPDDENAVFMWNTTAGADGAAKAQSILRTALWIIGLLTLISGVVGISNIMLITVKERTHEFGIRKALGARPRQILRGVIVESVAITTIFGYVGMLLGILATEYLNVVGGESKVKIEDMELTVFSNPTVDFATCIEALAVMIVAGIVAGLIPARKAVKVKPIEALRAE